MTSSRNIIRIGYLLIALGILLLFVGVFISIMMHSGSCNVGLGGIILIGPVPIAFGCSPQITTFMLYAGFFMFLMYILIRGKM
ncbi:MAG: DUF131 domain-containing protein [Methanomethylovorans sp.]|uniref:TIGR00304 family membrane protein n=1 Tax=Methanomethylovorans sp. TaxID=2758717 RepID=UPI000AA66A78|nr:DUF131 domain-containing protein [Methanomethylovorans sp.]